MIYLGKNKVSFQLNAAREALPLGNATDIKFSFQDGIVSMCWKDPDDLVVQGIPVAQFKHTRVVYKDTGIPENELDGTVVGNYAVRNEHQMHPLLIPGLDPSKTYYFRVFPCTTRGIYTNGVESKYACSFSTASYSWGMICQQLEDFPTTSASLLPPAGAGVLLDYIAADWVLSGSAKVACDTREKVNQNLDSLSSFESAWRVLGYNTNVPQYVKYRKSNGDGTFSYIRASSVNDRLAQVSVYGTDGQVLETRTVLSGDDGNPVGWQRPISIGCRTYVESYDSIQSQKTYTDTGKAILEVANALFMYRNQGLNGVTNEEYGVPLYITTEDGTYDFCGYTCTLGSQWALNNVLTSNSSNYGIVWDAAENLSCDPVNYYPIVASEQSDYGYYWKDDSGFHAIDIYSEHLAGKSTQDYNGHEVWVQDSDGQFIIDTQFWTNDRRYVKIDSAGNETKCIPVKPFAFNVECLTSNPFKGYDTNKAWFDDIVADYVWYNDKVWRCVKNVAYNNTTIVPGDSTSSFVEVTDGSVVLGQNGVLVGERIDVPENGRVVELNTDYRRYGAAIYSQSNIKQYLNHKDGYAERDYKVKSKFDTVSTNSWYTQGNGLMLKFAKERDFISHIIPVSNVVQASNINHTCHKTLGYNGRYYEHVVDKWFWLISYFEGFGTTADGTAVFKETYPNNDSRIKYAYVDAAGTVGASSVCWWLRSPYAGYPICAFIGNTTGSINYDSAYSSDALVPACLIG